MVTNVVLARPQRATGDVAVPSVQPGVPTAGSDLGSFAQELRRAVDRLSNLSPEASSRSVASSPLVVQRPAAGGVTAFAAQAQVPAAGAQKPLTTVEAVWTSPPVSPSGVGAGGVSAPISPRVNPPGFVSATAVAVKVETVSPPISSPAESAASSKVAPALHQEPESPASAHRFTMQLLDVKQRCNAAEEASRMHKQQVAVLSEMLHVAKSSMESFGEEADSHHTQVKAELTAQQVALEKALAASEDAKSRSNEATIQALRFQLGEKTAICESLMQREEELSMELGTVQEQLGEQLGKQITDQRASQSLVTELREEQRELRGELRAESRESQAAARLRVELKESQAQREELQRLASTLRGEVSQDRQLYTNRMSELRTYQAERAGLLEEAGSLRAEVQKLQQDADEDWQEQAAAFEGLAIGVQEMEAAIEQGRLKRNADKLQYSQEIAVVEAEADQLRRSLWAAEDRIAELQGRA